VQRHAKVRKGTQNNKKSMKYFGKLSNLLENYQMLWATFLLLAVQMHFFRAGWGGEGVCVL
jgi:hypothetical protein